MLAVDEPGTAAKIATRLAEQQISLESIVQRHPGGRPRGGDDPADATPVPVILITYATSEDAVRQALDKVVGDGVIVGKPQLIRIEKT
jgi:homoserine dehydrogenase